MNRFIPLGQAGGLANAGGLAGTGSASSPRRRFIPVSQAMALQGSPMEIRRGISGTPGPGSSPFAAPPSPVASRADPGMARAGLSIGGMNLGGNLADLGEPVSRGILNDAIRGFFGNTLGLGPLGARIGNEVVNFAIGRAPFPTSLVTMAINTATANARNQATANVRNQAMLDMAQPFGELPFGMPDPGLPLSDPRGIPPDPESLVGRTFGDARFSDPSNPSGYSYAVSNNTNFGTRGDEPDAPPDSSISGITGAFGISGVEGVEGAPTGGDPGAGPTGDDGLGDFAHGGTVKDRMRLPAGRERITAHEGEEVVRPVMARRYRPLLKAINRGESPIGLIRILASGAGMAQG